MADGQFEDQRNQETSTEANSESTVERFTSEAYSSMNDTQTPPSTERISQNSLNSSLPDLTLTGLGDNSKSTNSQFTEGAKYAAEGAKSGAEDAKPAAEKNRDSALAGTQAGRSVLGLSNRGVENGKPSAEAREPQQRTYKNEKGETVTEFTNDPGHRTKETAVNDMNVDQQDGGPKVSETEFKDHPDGRVKQSHYLAKDVTEYKNGTKVTDYDLSDKRIPEHNLKRVTESAKHGYISKEYEISNAAKNGASTEKTLDIQWTDSKKDDRVSLQQFSDNSSITTFRDGSTKRDSRDGNTQVYDKNGRRLN